MTLCLQVVLSLGLGIWSHMCALAYSGLYDGMIALPLQFVAGFVASSLMIVFIVPCGLLFRLLPFERRLFRGATLSLTAFLVGMVLMSMSASPKFAVVVEGPEVPELHLSVPLVLAGWVSMMLAPFLLSAGRAEPMVW